MASASEVRALIQDLLFMDPNQPGWEAKMRVLIRQYNDLDVLGALANDAVTTHQMEQFLGGMFQRYPDQVSTIAADLGIELGLSGEDELLQNYENVLEGLIGALGEGGSGLISNIIETIHQTTDETTTRTREVEEQIERGEDILSIRHETRFVDIPTAEEFMDNFETAIVTQASTLRRAGSIDRATADFMSNNFDVFLDSYIADLGRRIQAGEDILRVVGLDQGPVLVGSRPGEAVQEETTTTIEEITNRQTTIEDVIERTIARLIGEAGTQDGGAVDRNLAQNITEAVNSLFTEQLQGRLVEEQVRSLVSYTIEDVMTRPNLAAVFAFSPMQFLTERYSPTELMNIAASVPGREAAQARFPFGVAPSAPRRLQ